MNVIVYSFGIDHKIFYLCKNSSRISIEMEMKLQQGGLGWMRVWDKDRHPKASLSLLSYLMSQYIDVLVIEPKSILVCNITGTSKVQTIHHQI